ncbi:MAG: hypothetical protein L6Q37_10310 [Bdellovibrionaceae bacterium]|nr:hypothetical protein [Pseudobdellovibrionaceae bacterium]NUM57373.1 hypothetical protein [Pseudobdellovibrionaceae bacterium]
MKKMIMIIVMLSSSFVFANDQCIDLRAAFFSPCAQGEQRFYVQGICPKSYEVESTYCAFNDAPECLDVRTTLFAPCEEGKTRIYVQGRCDKEYKLEYTYCAFR